MNYHLIKLFIFNIFILFKTTLLYSVIIGTLIKTPNGLIPVENININDHLVGYSDGKITQDSVTNISITSTETIIVLQTKNSNLMAYPDQLFYDAEKQLWISAKDIKPPVILLDSRLNHCPCLNIKTISVIPTKVYHLTTTQPHNFFITNQELLTHNFFPIITLGASCLFGLGSIEFTGISIATLLGGTAIGITIFKKHSKQNQSFTITPQENNSYGGFSPDPNDDNNDEKLATKRIYNTISKTEFFKSTSKEYEYWRDGIYKKKHNAKGLSKKAEYLKWDCLHNDVEAYDKWGEHLGSYNPETLQLYKKADPTNRIKIK